MFRSLSLLLIVCGFADVSRAQRLEDPAAWNYEVKKTGDNSYDLIFHLTLKDGWHIWSMKPGGDGFQIPPTFTFDKLSSGTTAGPVVESGIHKHTGPMDGVEGEVSYYDGEVEYIQRVSVSGEARITGTHEYQVCNDRMCLPPKKIKFTFRIPS